MSESGPTQRRWIVWYLHWRFHSSRTEIWECNSRDDAFSTAVFLEDEAEDCVNEIIGIESPDGQFIDLAEYRAAVPAVRQARDAEYTAARDAAKAEQQFRITIAGPDGHEHTEVWSAKYIDKYRNKYLALFGPGRVKVEQIEAADA